MLNENEFKNWLAKNCDYSSATLNDVVSRVRRADKILPFTGNEYYLFDLERKDEFSSLTVSVKSQMRKAVKLYLKYEKDNK